jgi:hypothetical protein
VKTITLLAVMAALLLDFIGPKSSVGGPLTDLMLIFLTMLAVGIYEAVSEKRGAIGLIVNIIVAVIGGFAAASFGGLVTQEILSLVHFEGSLAKSHHPLLYISSAAIAILTVLGAWIALQIVNRSISFVALKLR